MWFKYKEFYYCSFFPPKKNPPKSASLKVCKMLHFVIVQNDIFFIFFAIMYYTLTSMLVNPRSLHAALDEVRSYTLNLSVILIFN